MNNQTDRSSTHNESPGSTAPAPAPAPAPTPILLGEEAILPFEHVEDEDMLMTDVVDTSAPDVTTYGVPDHEDHSATSSSSGDESDVNDVGQQGSRFHHQRLVSKYALPKRKNKNKVSNNFFSSPNFSQQDGSVPKSTPVFDAAATNLSYQSKIDELQQEALKTDDIARMEEIDARIIILQKIISRSNPPPAASSSTHDNNVIKPVRRVDESQCPVFQLQSDEDRYRLANKTSFQDVESFISALELFFDTNQLDHNSNWKLYLGKAFLGNSNPSHQRWFKFRIQRLDKNKVTWDDIKKTLVLRFGSHQTYTDRFMKYLSMKQDKDESLRNYMDRYHEAYERLPMKHDDQVHVANFLKNLLSATRLVVEKKLKNAVPANTIHLPNSLVILFQFLEIQVGEIEEEVAMVMKTREKRPHGQLSADEGASDIEKPDSSKRYRGTNKSLVLKKSSPPTNLCSYCKKAEFSLSHLNQCVDYLQSDRYKQRIVSLANQQPKNGNTQKVNVYCLKKEVKETNNLHNSYFSDDLEDAFGILEKELNFNLSQYHSSFSSTNNNMHPYVNTFMTNTILNNNNKNFMPIPILNQSIKIENDDIVCYNIRSLTEEDIKNMSPYIAHIIINGEQLIAIVDTGAQVSLLNRNYVYETQDMFTNIIPVKGRLAYVQKGSFSERIGKTQPLEIEYSGKLTLKHSFEIIEMDPSESKTSVILGRDLLPKLGIELHNLAHTFKDNEISIDESIYAEEELIPNVSKAGNESEHKAFMDSLKDCLQANSEINVHELCPLEEAVIYLNTTPGKVAFTRQYPIAYSLQTVVQEQIEKWLADRTIEVVTHPSAWNSAITLVPKVDTEGNKTKYRCCLDTRLMNALLPDISSMNLPRIDDIFYSLRHSKVYSVFDITGAFHRLRVNKEDRHKTTFTFNGKSYCFRGGCFGIKTLSSVFQNVMETIFQSMKDFTCIYIDDLIVHSETLELHEKHCKQVIEALTKNKLPLNQSKTHLGCKAVYLLGFCISGNGKSIDTRRLTNVDQWKKPSTPKQMMKFLGLVSYLRGHLPNASDLTAPLDGLRYSTDKVLTWTPQMDAHYDSIIKILKANITLSHPDLDQEFSLSVDASAYSVGACLFQEYKDEKTNVKHIKYIGFVSKALSKSQRAYSTTKRELFSLCFGLTKFYKFLHGNKPFKCYTDHRSLSYLYSTKHLSMMMLRYMEIILSFPNMNIIWLPGKDNVISDKLSRLFPSEQDVVVFEKDEKALFPHILKKKKERSRRVKKRTNKTSMDKTNIHPSSIKQFYVNADTQENACKIRCRLLSIKTIHDKLIDEVSEGNSEDNFQINYVQQMDDSYIVPPESERNDILKQAHDFGHWGGEAIVQRIRKQDGMNWPNILKDALEVVKRCSTCQKFSIAKRGYNPMTPLYCYLPGWHYQLDLCGPFPVTSSNNTYIMVLLDVATRFHIMRPIPDKTAKSVAKELVSIFSLMGFPRIINSDRGREFKNAIMDEICEAMKIDKRLSTAYYSQSNGGAERAIQNTKRLLSKLILGVAEDNWDLKVNAVQLMINCKISKRLQSSPFSLMFARRMTNDDPIMFDKSTSSRPIEPMSNEELLKRIDYMYDIVLPGISERTSIYNKTMKDQADKHRYIVDFPVGSFVTVRKKGIRKSLSPVYEGPYEVVRKTAGGNYTLRDEAGLLMPRDFTPSELKSVSQDEVITQEQIYEFDGIVNHRGDPGEREYLIRWKNYTSKDDSWITVDMFTDPQHVTDYWKRLKGSIAKKDASQIKAAIPTSTLPTFKPSQQKGPLLEAVDDLAESSTSKSNASLNNSTTTARTKTLSKTRTKPYKRTSSHTRPVSSNPVLESLRRNTRSNAARNTVSLAGDRVRFRK